VLAESFEHIRRLLG